jgi:hypothetical protein
LTVSAVGIALGWGGGCGIGCKVVDGTGSTLGASGATGALATTKGGSGFAQHPLLASPARDSGREAPAPPQPLEQAVASLLVWVLA